MTCNLSGRFAACACTYKSVFRRWRMSVILSSFFVSLLRPILRLPFLASPSSFGCRYLRIIPWRLPLEPHRYPEVRFLRDRLGTPRYQNSSPRCTVLGSQYPDSIFVGSRMMGSFCSSSGSQSRSYD